MYIRGFLSLWHIVGSPVNFLPTKQEQSMFIWLLIILGVIAGIAGLVIAVVLILAASKPDVFRMQRSVMVNADPSRIFPHINDFHNWAAWTPFDKLDPGMQKICSGADRGKGAIYEWSGNAKAGQGRMEITESTEPTKIVVDLAFRKPFKANNTAEFTMVPKGAMTELTWAMYGNMRFLMKIFHVFMNMDKMVGKDFEEGLVNLKSLAEK
jgi:hypothetical protein